MTKPQVDVITSVQRRRRWSREDKERIVAAAMEPGGCNDSSLSGAEQTLASGRTGEFMSSRPNLFRCNHNISQA